MKNFAITSDDLIPILVSVIIQSKPKHMKSNIQMMSYFTFSNFNSTSLGFTLVSVSAAIEYLSNATFGGSENKPVSVTTFSKSFEKTSQNSPLKFVTLSTTSNTNNSNNKNETTSEKKDENSNSNKKQINFDSPTKKKNENDEIPKQQRQLNVIPAPLVIDLKKQEKSKQELGEFLSSLT